MDSEKVARIDKMEKWGYPDRIKMGINAKDNTKVNLLISINCFKVLKPHE